MVKLRRHGESLWDLGGGGKAPTVAASYVSVIDDAPRGTMMQANSKSSTSFLVFGHSDEPVSH